MRKSIIVLAFLLAAVLRAENWGEWHVLFDQELNREKAQEISKGETAFDEWKIVSLQDYACDLDDFAGQKMPLKSVAVLVCKVTSEADKSVLVGTGTDWWYECFVNGESFSATGEDGNIAADINQMNFVFPIKLKAGENTVAFFLTRGAASWKFTFARIIDSALLPADFSEKSVFIDKLFGKLELSFDEPYVVRMSSTSASVGIEFNQPVSAGIKFKNEATGEERTLWTMANGLRTLEHIHRFDLSGLEPASKYSYSIITLDEAAAKEVVRTSGTFMTYPGNGLGHAFFAISDTQVGAKARTNYLNMMFQNCGMGKADFIVSLGDMDSHFSNFRNIYFKSFFNVLKDNGYPRQAELLRGNHEYRGPQTDLFNNFFGKGYFAFKYGDAFYIALDCGEDKKVVRKPDHYTLRNELPAYFKEQAEWFETIVNSDDCKNAKVRIVFAHTVPFKFENGFFYQNVSSVVGKYLYGPNPPCKIDLWLCGDIHSPYRYDPVAKKFIGAKRKLAERKKNGIAEFNYDDITFPVFVNDGPGGAGVTVSTTKVLVSDDGIRVTNFTPEGAAQDDFTIRRGQPFEVHSTTFVDYTAMDAE